jgi:hypothetical protein
MVAVARRVSQQTRGEPEGVSDRNMDNSLSVIRCQHALSEMCVQAQRSYHAGGAPIT